MSKSLGNGVDLGEQIDAFGVDAIRLTVVFAGPPEADIDWADMSPGGLAEVPAAGLAAERRRDLGAGHVARRRRPGAAQGHPQDRARGRRSWSSRTASTCWWRG